MRTPSIKTLSEVFGEPSEAKRVFQMRRSQLLKQPAGAERDRESGGNAYTYDVRLHVLNSLDDGLHGIEAIKIVHRDSDDEYAEYLNTGDSYAATVIYWRGRYRVQCVGDFVEMLERRHIRVE